MANIGFVIQIYLKTITINYCTTNSDIENCMHDKYIIFLFIVYEVTFLELCPGGCMNGGSCIGVNTCACLPGYRGHRCEIGKVRRYI